MFSSEEQSKRQERGQTIVSSGGVCFVPSAKVEVRVKARCLRRFAICASCRAKATTYTADYASLMWTPPCQQH